MLSVVSFLFGFFITITFSMLLTKVASLKDALAVETGRLVAIYSLSKHLGKKFHEKIAERIDNYTKITLRDYTQYEKGREIIYGMYEDASLMEIKTLSENEIVGSFFYILGELEPVREKLEYLTSRRLEWSLKLSSYVFGSLLIILLFLNRGDSFTNAIFVILSTVIVFVFLIIKDYDRLRIGDYAYNISNSEQLFDLIGKERYYPESILSRVELEDGKKYRIGFLDRKTHQEKIILMTYSPGFSNRVADLIKKITNRKG